MITESELTRLNRDIIRGRAEGRVLFQPRILAWLSDREFRGEALPGEYKGCGRVALYEKLGCSDRLYDFSACLETRYDDSVTVQIEPLEGRDYRRVFTTPVGTVSELVRSNTSNYGLMPEKWLVEEREDLRVFAYVEEATTYSFNMDTYNKLHAELGHLGLPISYMYRAGLQRMICDISGVENTFYLLSDYPEEVEHYLAALSRSHEGMTRVLAESPLEWVNYGDNLHCRILPVYMFKKYVLPEYEKRGDILHKAGKFVHSHWDGDVKDYLPLAKHCFLDGIEAITPEPQGDVTIEEVKAALGDDILLLDGLASVLFTEDFPVELLERETRKTLDLFAGQLILGISDEMPSTGTLDRVECVCEIVDGFNRTL